MRQVARVALALLGVMLMSQVQIAASPKAHAGHCFEDERSHWSHGQLITTIVVVCPDHSDPAGTGTGPPSSPPSGSAACLIAAETMGVSPEELCATDDNTLPAVTDDLVATAFRRIPLPPSTFTIQPPGGRTLVNFETNFFTDQDGTLERSVRLLGQRVDLRIEADSYTWRFGDGESITTSGPGAPYPKLLVTHNYRSKGEYGPALDITWVADYRVGGGAWQPVPGSVTISGSPAELRAIEARPTLVGYGG